MFLLRGGCVLFYLLGFLNPMIIQAPEVETFIKERKIYLHLQLGINITYPKSFQLSILWLEEINIVMRKLSKS